MYFLIVFVIFTLHLSKFSITSVVINSECKKILDPCMNRIILNLIGELNLSSMRLCIDKVIKPTELKIIGYFPNFLKEIHKVSMVVRRNPNLCHNFFYFLIC